MRRRPQIRLGFAVPELDVDTPNLARVCGYLLDGSTHCAVDRAAGEEFFAGYPGIATWVRTNRAFLARAIREARTV